MRRHKRILAVCETGKQLLLGGEHNTEKPRQQHQVDQQDNANHNDDLGRRKFSFLLVWVRHTTSYRLLSIDVVA